MTAGADRNRESQLWAWLRKAADMLRKDADVQRIENGVAKGTPDVEGCIRGETFWCELKVAHAMANDRWRIHITVSQVRRARARRRAGGRSWVLIRACGATAHLNRHYLVDGFDAEHLLEPVSTDELQKMSAVHADASSDFILQTMAGK